MPLSIDGPWLSREPFEVMAFSWVHEASPARWDADKARIIGGGAPGIFDTRLARCEPGVVIPAEWWHVEENGETLGYGWLDVSWGDAEILLATDTPSVGRGVGSFIIDNLDREAASRGLNYLYNVVRSTHPDGERVSAWLTRRGFEPSEDGRLLRRVVSR